MRPAQPVGFPSHARGRRFETRRAHDSSKHLRQGASSRRTMAQDARQRRYFAHGDVNGQIFRRLRLPSGRGGNVLDFGCGGGNGREDAAGKLGYDAYGVDIRWPGADYGDLAGTRSWPGGHPAPVRRGRRPDAVRGRLLRPRRLSDQVFEHVVPIEESLSGAGARADVPTGSCYHHFPVALGLAERGTSASRSPTGCRAAACAPRDTRRRCGGAGLRQVQGRAPAARVGSGEARVGRQLDRLPVRRGDPRDLRPVGKLAPPRDRLLPLPRGRSAVAPRPCWTVRRHAARPRRCSAAWRSRRSRYA